MADSRAQGFCEPVGVQPAEHLRFECVVAFGEVHLRLGVRRGVDTLDAFGFEFLPGVAEVVACQVGHRHLDASGVGHQLLIAGQAFGLDDDDAVGGLRAVEGLGRGVLEYGDAFDTGHVHVHHLLGRGFEPVEDEQRLVGPVLVVALDIHARGFRGKGGDAAQLHVRQRVGVGTHQCVVHDVERRFDVFQALEDVAVAHAGQLARRDGRGRTRVALLLAGEDTGHHDVLDLLLVLHQSDQSGLCRGKRLRDVADVGEDQVVAALGHADRESAVGTRHDSRAGPLDQDVHAHERRTGRIRHASADDLVRSFLRGGLMALPLASGADHDGVVVDRAFEPRAAQRFVEHFAHRGVGLAEGDASDPPHGVAIIKDVISRLLFDPLEDFGQRRVAERYGDAFPALLVGLARRRLPGHAPGGNRQQPHAHGEPWPPV